MSRASTEVEQMRSKMMAAVDLLSPEDLKAMLRCSLAMAVRFELNEMANATSFKSFENMDFGFGLTA